jgi:hypothetical protein
VPTGASSAAPQACKVHRLAQSVMVDSKLQRFCQQCSRFEDVDSFDGANR